MDWLSENDLIYRQRNHIPPRIAAGTGIGHLIQQLEDRAAVHVAHEVGHVWRHQQRHGKLMLGEIRDSVYVHSNGAES